MSLVKLACGCGAEMEFEDKHYVGSLIRDMTIEFWKHKCVATPASASSTQKAVAPETAGGTLMWALKEAAGTQCGIRRHGWLCAIFPRLLHAHGGLFPTIVTAKGELEQQVGHWPFSSNDIMAEDWEIVSEEQLKAEAAEARKTVAPSGTQKAAVPEAAAPEANAGTFMWALKKALDVQCGIRRHGWCSAIFPKSFTTIPLNLTNVTVDGKLEGFHEWHSCPKDLMADDWELVSEDKLKADNFRGSEA